MRKLAVLTMLCVLAAPALADYYGGRMAYSRIFGYFMTSGDARNGGEMTLGEETGFPYLSNAAYATVTKAQDGDATSFQTFCVEVQEHTAQPLDIWMSTTWTDPSNPPSWGGAGMPASHAILGGQTAGDDLNPETAYLYYNFAKGTLSNYDYTDTGVGRDVSAGALQLAIWTFEGEYTTPLSGQALTWYNEAVTATGSGGSWGQTIGPVRVLNMYGNDGNGNFTVKKQDMLYLIPAPGAALLGVIGIGLAGWINRKQ